MLKDYLLVYSITALPTVLYSSYTTAAEPLTFDADKLHIPKDLNGMPVELRVSLYGPDGGVKEMTSTMLPSAAATIAVSANLTGLKLVAKAVDEIKKLAPHKSSG